LSAVPGVVSVDVVVVLPDVSSLPPHPAATAATTATSASAAQREVRVAMGEFSCC
jgi:hypothetical protein